MTAALDLVWLPLGAGASGVVRWSGRAFESVCAARERRPRRALFHAALLVTDRGQTWAVEMVPQWSRRVDGARVAVVGPVGIALLGRSRWFRYELRRSPGGWLPDAGYAVARTSLSDDPRTCRAVLSALPEVPRLVWGRRPPGGSEMWNSNSVIAWLLAATGLDPRTIGPPTGGRAPGWVTGTEVADAGHARPRAAGR